MSEQLGPLTFGQSNEHIFLGRDFGHVRDYSEEIATQIDAEMKRIISTLYDDTTKLLTGKRKHMDAITQVLLEKETLEKEEFEEIVKKVDSGTFVFEARKPNGKSQSTSAEISSNGATVPQENVVHES